MNRWIASVVGYGRLGLIGLVIVGAIAHPGRAQTSARGAALTGSARADSSFNGVQRIFERVDSLRRHRQFRESLAVLSELRDARPYNVEVLYRLAFTWSDLGKAAESERQSREFYQQSLNVAEEAVEADSASAWAHFAVAVAQGRLTFNAGVRKRVERSRAVKAHAEQALALDSTLAGAYHVRGRWHREAADLNFVPRAVVSAIYGGLPNASIDQAVRDFQTAIDLEDRAYHHLELGKTYLVLDRPTAAREQFRKAIAVPHADPFDPEYKQEARRLLDAL